MGRKPKLTPTTNDALHGNGAGPMQLAHSGTVRPFIVAPHEPEALSQTPWRAPISFSIPEQTVNMTPTPQVQPLKIALVGTAPSSRMLAPFNDPTWTIWACSPGNAHGALPRVDAWFEIHGNMLWPENRHYGEPYLKWLAAQTFPIYMQTNQWLPNATPFPMREMVKEFGPYFFTSSFSWMMALAITRGASELALFGIDMASREEYIIQRPGAYYFFTEAKKRGIKIAAPYESDILQPPTLYGFSEVTPFGRKLLARKAEIKGRLTEMRGQRDGLSHNITYLEGALEDLDYVESIFGGVQNNEHPDLTNLGQG